MVDNKTLQFKHIFEYLRTEYWNKNSEFFDNKKFNFHEIMAAEIRAQFAKQIENGERNGRVPSFTKTLQSIISDKRFFDQNEIIPVCNAMKKLADEWDSSGNFNFLFLTFLKAYNEYYSDIRIQQLIKDCSYSDTTLMEKTRWTNLDQVHSDKVIHPDLIEDINSKISNGYYIFLYGSHGTGKKYNLNNIANEYYRSKTVNYAFFFDGNSSFDISLFFNTILTAASNLREINDNLTLTELCEKTSNFLRNNSSLIFIDAFEAIECRDRDFLIEFLRKLTLKKINVIVLIASDKEPFNYSYIWGNKIFYTKLAPKYSDRELEKLSTHFNDAGVNEALRENKKLQNFVINHCNGRPSEMKRMTNNFLERMRNGETFEKIKKDYRKKA